MWDVRAAVHRPPRTSAPRTSAVVVAGRRGRLGRTAATRPCSAFGLPPPPRRGRRPQVVTTSPGPRARGVNVRCAGGPRVTSRHIRTSHIGRHPARAGTPRVLRLATVAGRAASAAATLPRLLRFLMASNEERLPGPLPHVGQEGNELVPAYPRESAALDRPHRPGRRRRRRHGPSTGPAGGPASFGPVGFQSPEERSKPR